MNSSFTRHLLGGVVLMMAWQVVAKAARDALFLSSYGPSALPAMVGSAAVCSILLALFSSRLMLRWGPARMIPFGFLFGGILHLAEWILLPRFPQVISATLYLHVSALGAVILSGFWALISELLNPREARKRLGQIGAFGTIGSLTGGLMAERVVSLSAPIHLLILLAILQFACFAFLVGLRSESASTAREAPSIPEVISSAPYLLQLALFVLFLSMSAAMLDFLFKSQSVARFGRGPELSRFFALFYTVVSVLTFVVQVGLTKWCLNRLGLGRTVAALPVAVTGASILSLMFPGAISLTISRGIELLFRGSLFRSAYDLFLNPMPNAERRSVKSMIDIGAERMGDGLAAATIQLFLVFPAAILGTILLALAAALSGISAWMSFRLGRAYVRVLERGLKEQTIAIPADEIEDELTRTVLLKSQAHSAKRPVAVSAPITPNSDPSIFLIAGLRSDDPVRIRAILQRPEPIPPAALPVVMELLGDDRCTHDAHRALARVVDRAAGQIGDVLADLNVDVKVRRRLPRILAESDNPIVPATLLRELQDPRFEIRQRCAKGLARICERQAGIKLDATRILDAVADELRRQSLFKNYDAPDSPQSKGHTDGKHLPPRASQSIAHVATMLGLIFPAQSIRIACKALESKDSKLRGVALEYLDSILPKVLADLFTRVVEPERLSAAAPAARGQSEDALSVLKATSSLMLEVHEVSASTEDDDDLRD